MKNRNTVIALLGVLLLAIGTYVAYAAMNNPTTSTQKVEAVSQQSGTHTDADCPYHSMNAASAHSADCAAECAAHSGSHEGCCRESKGECPYMKHEAAQQKEASPGIK